MITIDTRNTRIYLRGDTYAAKDQIKAAGGHWDPDERAWWVGKAKLAEAEAICATAAPQRDTITDETVIRGKASYKGKAGYLILWIGTTSRGEAAKLAFRDGSKVYMCGCTKCEGAHGGLCEDD